MDQHNNANRKRKFQLNDDRSSGIPSATDNDLTDRDRAIRASKGDDSTKKDVSPDKKPKVQDESSDIIRVGHNLRVRRSAIDNAIENSPYLAPWHKEKLRRRNERSGVTMGKSEPESDVPGASTGPAVRTPTPPPETSEDARSLAMFLGAAKVLDQNVIPCTSPGCPVTHPHGEGPYLFEGKVPNSELANVYFSPSVPPPAVVKAFNAVDGMPSSKDLEMKDRFFEYHTAPCRPSKHLNKVWARQCKSKNCGVDLQPHKKGAYLHEGIDASLHQSRRSNHAFGISNPPPEVWESAFRVQDGNATDRDHERVNDFSAHHACFIKGDARRAELQSWQKERRNERP